MKTYELPQDYPEEFSVISAVLALKEALIYMKRVPSWETSDGSGFYAAFLLEDEEPNPFTIDSITVEEFMDSYNAWSVTKFNNPDPNGEVLMERYRLIAGLPLRVFDVTLDSSFATTEAGVDQFEQTAKEEATLQKSLGMDLPDTLDYALLENALDDLKPVAKAAEEAFKAAILSKTPDELRWERMQEYRIIYEGKEPDKTSEARWFGISAGSMAYAVYAKSSAEAIMSLEDHCGHQLFPLLFVDPYDSEEHQEILKSRLHGRAVARLIPFSLAEWPEDLDNMTDEQRAAIDRLSGPAENN